MEKTPDFLDFFIIKGVPKRSLLIHNMKGLSSDHSPIIGILGAAPTNTQRPASLITKTDWNQYREFPDHAINLKVRLKSTQELDSAVQLFITAHKEAAEVSTPRAQMAQSPTIEYPDYISIVLSSNSEQPGKSSKELGAQKTRQLSTKSTANSLANSASSEMTVYLTT